MGTFLSVIGQGTMLSLWDDIVDGISNIIGSVLWLFSDIFFILLNLFETLFRKFAGIDDNVTTATGEKIEGDLVLYFANSDLVQQIFMSILVLSLFLLVIFTILAIVKNMYAEKQEPVTKIINSSIKALLMYLLVPVATVVCLIVGNIVLQAIDGATKLNPYAQTSADALFASATYNANRLRTGTTKDKAHQLEVMIEDNMLSQAVMELIEAECNIDLEDTDSYNMDSVDYDRMAVIIDEAFMAGELSSSNGANESSKYNWTTVNNFYYALKISYISIWIGGAFMIWAIGKITWGMVARLFKMVLFYAISPAVMATFPIDGGKALSSWRGEMVKLGTSAYCAIGVLNVLYSILPFFTDIDLFGDGVTGGGLATSIARLFIYIIAFSSAKDLINLVGGWFGTGNALADGISAKGQVAKPLKTAATKSVGMFAGIKGGMAAAEKHKGNKFWGAVAGGLSATPFGKNVFGEEFQKGKKAGGEAYKTGRTMSLSADKRDQKLAIYEGYDAVDAGNKKLQGQLDAAERDKAKKLQAAGDSFARGDISLTEFEKQRDDIIAEYNKITDKIKSTASYLDILFEDAQRELDDQKKKNEKRQSNFAAFDSLEQGYEQDKIYRERVATASGWTGMTDAIWEEVKQGDFSHVAGGYKSKVKEAYGMYASNIASNEHSMQRAQQTIENLAQSGADGYEAVEKILGDKFESMFSVVKDAEGIVKSVNLKDTFDIGEISEKIQAEQTAINDALKKWEKATKDMVEQRAHRFAEITKDDLEKIGKSSGGK